MRPVLPDYFPTWQDWVSAFLYELEAVVTRDELFDLVRLRQVRDISSDTTVTLSDYHVRVDISSGPVTVTLPEVSVNLIGYEWKVTLVSAPTYACSVVPSGSDDITGGSSVSYTNQWASRTYRARENGWDIVSGYSS